MRRKAVLALALSLLTSLSARATTYVMMRDEDLADQADLIARVRVEAAAPAPEWSGHFATDYTVRVERALKGDPGESRITVRVPGGEGPDGPDGVRLHVWGAPRFRRGEEALLFLAARADGTYGVLHLMLGAFHGIDGFAVRDLSETQPLPGGAPGEPEGRLRHLERFSDWIAERAAGRDAEGAEDAEDAEDTEPGYWVEGRLTPEKYTFFTSGGTSMRWFDFDGGGEVVWLTQAAGTRGLPGGGVAEFQQGLQAWNDDPATPIRLTYGGTVARAEGLNVRDGLNVILYEDPHGEVDGIFDCEKGGVAALGGVFLAAGGPRPFNGRNFYAVSEGKIVTQDGLSCLFERPGGSSLAARLFAHELGHTLALGHTCDDQASPCNTPGRQTALMRSKLTHPQLGAILGADDRLGIRVLYGDGLINPLLPPGDLVAVRRSATSIELSWADNSTQEVRFFVERQAPSGRFVRAASTAANKTAARINGLTPGKTYVFRVRAKGRKGFSEPSETLTVRVGR
jgi:hypothetical protein